MPSLAALQKRRATLHVLVICLVLAATALAAISARDSSGAGLRAGMVLLTAGTVFLLPWYLSPPTAVSTWLGLNYARSTLDEAALFNSTMLLELPGLLAVATFCLAIRYTVRALESDSLALTGGLEGSVDPETGVLEEKALRPAIEAELTRSRRFDHAFAFVLVNIDEKHQRFAFRDEEEWLASFKATAQLLKRTRANIDRVYRFGSTGFALLLPESGEREVAGLVRRLRKLATHGKPREGQPGGPLPVAFGATFFPSAASTVDDMLRRAEIALKIAAKNSTRMQLDGAEAPAMERPETMRQRADEEFSATEGAMELHLADAWNAEPVRMTPPPRPEPVTPPPSPYIAELEESYGPDEERPELLMSHTDTAGEPDAPTDARQAIIEGRLDDDVAASIDPPADTDVAPSRMSDDELTELLSRLDETLGLLRGLRTRGP